jgi:hypothetical protein
MLRIPALLMLVIALGAMVAARGTAERWCFAWDSAFRESSPCLPDAPAKPQISG